MHPISHKTAPHYKWADVCDGWRLVDHSELSILEERVPPKGAEVRHYHEKARQFFYILSGEATLEIESHEYKISEGTGMEVPPGSRHRFMNQSDRDVVFLVTSVPSTREDRINLE